MKGAPEFRGIVIRFHSKKTKDLKQISEHGLQITISDCHSNKSPKGMSRVPCNHYSQLKMFSEQGLQIKFQLR
jgi:hypothetical protein